MVAILGGFGYGWVKIGLGICVWMVYGLVFGYWHLVFGCLMVVRLEFGGVLVMGFEF